MTSKEPRITYAQNREDLIIAAFFRDKNKGFYVDVGAHDPIIDSVTKYFYEKGWRGINIEPQAEQYKKLCNDRKEDINLNIGIADREGEMTLRSFSNSGLSTFSKDAMREVETNRTGGKKYEDIAVRIKTLTKTFDENKVTDIDFIKIDVEGLEGKVINGLDWSKYRPKLVCIEANHISDNWPERLIANKYSLVLNDGLNDYYVAKEHNKIAADFKENYPKIILANSFIQYLPNQKIASLKLALSNEKNNTKKLERHIANIETKLSKFNSVRYTRDHLVQLARKRLAITKRKR